MEPILEVKDLKVRFRVQDGYVHAVNGISYDLNESESLGIVGESGCGKSVSVLTLMRLIDIPPGEVTNGEIYYNKRDLLKLSTNEIRQVRGKQIGMVFQDPMTSLNPVLTIGRQLTETLELHMNMNHKQALARSAELLGMVGIPQAGDRLSDYPHQFSGGMRQRVMIAMALACVPQILIADEPTTALDVTIQAQIVDLVKRLRDELGMAVIWITHDLGVVARMAQRILVMYAGYIIEEAASKDLYAEPSPPVHAGPAGQPAARGPRRASAAGLDRWPASRPGGRAEILPVCSPLHVCDRAVPAGKPAPDSSRPRASDGLLGRRQDEDGARMSENTNEVLLKVDNLVKQFPIKRGLLIQKQVGAVHAVDGVSFFIRRGETLGLVGESGCGKSTTGRTILQLYRPTSGSVVLEGVDLVKADKGTAAEACAARCR